jgi:hypothetical protein
VLSSTRPAAVETRAGSCVSQGPDYKFQVEKTVLKNAENKQAQQLCKLGAVLKIPGRKIDV